MSQSAWGRFHRHNPRRWPFILCLFPMMALRMHTVEMILDNHGNFEGFREAQIKECEVMGISAAVVAQVAITAIQLEGMSQAHWSARAFLAMALLSAFCSVFASGIHQSVVGSFFGYNKRFERFLIADEKRGDDRASFRAALALGMPGQLLYTALFCLWVGYVIYLGSLARANIGNLIICVLFVVGITISGLIIFGPWFDVNGICFALGLKEHTPSPSSSGKQLATEDITPDIRSLALILREAAEAQMKCADDLSRFEGSR